MAEEAAPFRRWAAGRPHLAICLTGVGQANAARRLGQALAGTPPGQVLTCGYAGGLDVGLAPGTVLFSADDATGLGPKLAAAGARAARFHCADRIITTAAEKRRLRETTGADAVEMESGVIRRICAEQGVPGATIRVISDTAGEDLPLDLNLIYTEDWRLDYGRVARTVLRSPGAIAGLLRLQRRARFAAEQLGEVLARALAD